MPAVRPQTAHKKNKKKKKENTLQNLAQKVDESTENQIEETAVK